MIKGAGTIVKKCSCTAKTRCEHGWTLRFWDAGRQREKTFRDALGPDGKVRLGSGKKLAEDFAVKLAHDKRAGDRTYDDRARGDILFAEYAATWIAARRAPSTRSAYMTTLRRLSAPLAGRSLRWVAEHREEVQAMLSAESPAYQAQGRGLIVGAANEAVRAGRLTGHRLRGLTVAPVSQRAEFTFASSGQIEQLADKLGNRGLLAWLGRLAGLRIGESLGLNRADFREGGSVVRVTRQRLPAGNLGPLKARREGEYRDVPVSPALWRKVCEADADADGYYFAHEYRKTVMRHYNAARDAVGLPASYHPHTLRHQYASVLLANGVPISDVSAYLGHKHINITYAVYGHVVPSSLDRAREIIDATL